MGKSLIHTQECCRVQHLWGGTTHTYLGKHTMKSMTILWNRMYNNDSVFNKLKNSILVHAQKKIHQ